MKGHIAGWLSVIFFALFIWYTADYLWTYHSRHHLFLIFLGGGVIGLGVSIILLVGNYYNDRNYYKPYLVFVVSIKLLLLVFTF